MKAFDEYKVLFIQKKSLQILDIQNIGNFFTSKAFGPKNFQEMVL